MPKLKIIAFDLGASFAWACNFGAHSRVGHNDLNAVRAHRMGMFAEHAKQILHVHSKPDTVVYETPFARGRDATRSLWGMAGVLEAAAYEAGLPIVDVSVATIKKFATGSGNAPKTDMIAAARRLKYRGSNEHEADAYCLLKYAEKHLEKVNP